MAEKPTEKTTIVAQIQKITLDTKGILKLEVGVPLHVAVGCAQRLIEAYGQNIHIVLQ